MAIFTILPRFAPVAAILLLGACASVSSETVEPIVVDGETFQLRTRTYERANGTFEATTARVGYTSVQCLKDSPNDCERKIRQEVEFRRYPISTD